MPLAPICCRDETPEWDYCNRGCVGRAYPCLRVSWAPTEQPLMVQAGCVGLPTSIDCTLYPDSCDWYGYAQVCGDPSDGRIMYHVTMWGGVLYCQCWLISAYTGHTEVFNFTSDPGTPIPPDTPCENVFVPLSFYECDRRDLDVGERVVDPTDETDVLTGVGQPVPCRQVDDADAGSVNIEPLTTRCRQNAPWFSLPGATYDIDRCDDDAFKTVSDRGQVNACQITDEGTIVTQRAHYPTIWRGTLTGATGGVDGVFHLYAIGNPTPGAESDAFQLAEESDLERFFFDPDRIEMTGRLYTAGNRHEVRINYLGSEVDDVVFLSAGIDTASTLSTAPVSLSYVSGDIGLVDFSAATITLAPIRAGRPNLATMRTPVDTPCWGWGYDPPRVKINYSPGNGNGPYVVSLDRTSGLDQVTTYEGLFVGDDGETRLTLTMSASTGAELDPRWCEGKMYKDNTLTAFWTKDFDPDEYAAPCDISHVDPQFFDCFRMVGYSLPLEDWAVGFESAAFTFAEFVWDLCQWEPEWTRQWGG